MRFTVSHPDEVDIAGNLQSDGYLTLAHVTKQMISTVDFQGKSQAEVNIYTYIFTDAGNAVVNSHDLVIESDWRKPGGEWEKHTTIYEEHGNSLTQIADSDKIEAEALGLALPSTSKVNGIGVRSPALNQPMSHSSKYDVDQKEDGNTRGDSSVTAANASKPHINLAQTRKGNAKHLRDDIPYWHDSSTIFLIKPKDDRRNIFDGVVFSSIDNANAALSVRVDASEYQIIRECMVVFREVVK